METRTLGLVLCVVLLAASFVASVSFSLEADKFRGQSEALADQVAGFDVQLLDVNRQTANLQNQKAALESEVAALESEVAALEEEKLGLETQLEGNATHVLRLEAQVANLGSQVDYFRNRTLVLYTWEEEERSRILASATGNLPILITRVGATEFRDEGRLPRVYVAGTVYNIGTASAENARLRIILHQGGSVAADVTVSVGKLDVYSQAYVRQNVEYAGGPLSSIEILREYG